MAVTFDILGAPGRDNALFVRIDSGQGITRLLFDCGDGCLNAISFSEIQAIDELFFSHLHMDHVGGFDYFFRCVFDRTSKPNRIWGPPETARILQHRFQGFLWNLCDGMRATWRVKDIAHDSITTTRFESAEAFATAHDEGGEERGPYLIDNPGFTVEAHTMDHRTPSIAYVVREKPRVNFDIGRMTELGMRSGPWMKIVKDLSDPTETVKINGIEHSVASLRASLLVATPGDSVAYLTDFLLNEQSLERLAGALRGCRTIVCEGQYRHADLELAHKNFHMTTALTGELARRAHAERLILFHLSDRYDAAVWQEMLAEAREQFPLTTFPAAWRIEPSAEV